MILDCGGKPLDLSRPRVMGILNVTPDSFSDGGRFDDLDRAVAQAERMVEEGADLIDIGGESTRPGAKPVSPEDEIRRVVPVVERLARRLPVPLSVDTSKPEVMRAAAAAGAGMINDVRALREPGALEAAAETGLPVCLMHMQGQPGTMQSAPAYDDVVTEIAGFLADRMDACVEAGISPDSVLVDPGFGFGKTLDHNLTLLARLNELLALGRPLLIGVSRKSMFGQLLDLPVEDRLLASVLAAVMAAGRGAALVRVHDVRETVQALALWRAVEGRRGA